MAQTDNDAVPSVRQFMPNPHSNGVSNNVLNMRLHMTRGIGASKEVATKQSNLDEEEKRDVQSLTS